MKKSLYIVLPFFVALSGYIAEAQISAPEYGIYGETDAPLGYGIFGIANNISGSNAGLYGLTRSPSGYGVIGWAPGTAIYGVSYSTSGRGIYGWASATSSTTYGVYGLSSSTSGVGVYGLCNASTGASTGVYGQSNSSEGVGVFGIAVLGSGNSSIGVLGSGRGMGVRGIGIGGGTGVYGSSSEGFAGIFAGNVAVSGNLSKGSGSFKIDHPLDPENKYLYHSFVESPDMMNVYNGNVILDATGESVVELPAYFETLNRDFRYQLTAIGTPGPNLHIAQKINNNYFRISGGQPGMEVSWQVTGIRQDPYAKGNPIIPEVEKPDNERGTFLHPLEYSQPVSKGHNQLAPLSLN